jgi:cobalt-zinc-cadmium efflux system outer membrane protein
MPLESRVRSQWRILRAARETRDLVDAQGLPATESLVESSITAWKAGKGELVQVLIARRDLASARLRRLDTMETAWRAYGDLVGLTGELP